MADKYAAFISYAHRDKAWVQVLQRNLELCLAAAGRPGKVFLDEVDLASGRSWVGQLQVGLDRSDQLILVATPESLASPRVADEWRSFVASRADWSGGRLHIVHLVEVPFPPFLTHIQFVDFRSAGEESYRLELQKLIGGLLGKTDGRDLPDLPNDIEIPSPPAGRLDPHLRSQLVDWLAPILAKKAYRLALAPVLGFKPEQLEDQGSWTCGASAALVWASGQEEPVTAALRVIDTLQETFGEDEPERVAALSPLRAELAARHAESPDRNLLSTWLHYTARDHEHLVPLQEQIALTLLDRVYVQLAVRPDLHRTGDPAPGRLDQTPTLRDLLVLNRREHPWVTGRWVVLGDPGAGKTTLLRHLAANLAKQEDRPWVPLFESLPRLLRDRASLLDRAVRRLERAGHPAQGLAEALDRAGRAGKLLLLLDGLDEVPKESQEEAEQLLRDLAVRWPDAPLVVTSRPIGYRSQGAGFREVDLLPLDHNRRRKLLARWFGRMTGTSDEARADRALQALDAPELQEVAGNPLYLTLMALLFEQEIAPDRNRTRLYDQVFDLLLEGKHRPEAGPIELKDTVRALLRRLAFGMTKDNRDAESAAALEDRLYRPEMDVLREKLERVGRWRGRLRFFLDELAEKTGILGPHDGPDADWRFWHRTFREALTAESLWGQYQEREGRAAVLAGAKAVTKEEDLSRWAEPFALLAGLVTDPDDLVKALVHENRPLGLRALATAQRLRVETVREVLALSEKWEERAKVYRHIPELVGEPSRALALIDQLRCQTRNGNDLYFLDSAAREVSRLSPEHAQDVEILLARFFDHIPRPPEELFQWIETPLDGRSHLWREIPAGRFCMAGPLAKWLGSAHTRQVEITTPFRCGAVPVTNAQYAYFDLGHEAVDFEGVQSAARPHHPVVSVTWFEAIAFCRWLAAAVPFCCGARLPTEEEWDYASRAGSPSRYWSGEEEKDLAFVGWCKENSSAQTHRVGEKPSNPWGLYDVHGNVWEWTLSPYVVDDELERKGTASVNPSVIKTTDVEYADDSALRVMLGGTFWSAGQQGRALHWNFAAPRFKDGFLGFRVVIPAKPEFRR